MKGRIAPLALMVAVPFLLYGCGSGSAGPSDDGASGGGVPETGTISGTVTDAANSFSLPGVAVTASADAAGGSVLATTVTDDLGRYTLAIPVGGCYLRYSKENYITSDGRFVAVSGGATATVNAAITDAASGDWNVLDPADFDRLMATGNCPGCRLYGAALGSASLSGACLPSANLAGADLRSADLSGANLTGTYLTGADLSGASLSGAYLTGGKLVGAILVDADLSHADLTFWADLSGADLTGADLSGADLSAGSQYLSGANLTGTILTGANLSGTIWTDGRVCASDSIGECR